MEVFVPAPFHAKEDDRMSQVKQNRAHSAGQENGRLVAGALVMVKRSFSAVPASGSRAKIRISAGTTGIIEDGVVKSCVVGEPDLPFISFEKPGGRVVCVAADPSAIAPL
jgi:hypothetical protein